MIGFTYQYFVNKSTLLLGGHILFAKVVERKNFDSKKYFHNYLHVGNSKNFGLEYDFGQSLDMRYHGV